MSQSSCDGASRVVSQVAPSQFRGRTGPPNLIVCKLVELNVVLIYRRALEARSSGLSCHLLVLLDFLRLCMGCIERIADLLLV